jgi:hypothetical protein
MHSDMKLRTRWTTIAFGAVVAILLLTHLVLRPNADRADSEPYVVYSEYIEPRLTGESHDLGSRDGITLIHRNTHFVLGSVERAKAAIPQLRRSILFEFFIANLHAEQLEGRFHLTAKYELPTQEEMNLHPSEQFMRRFPRSYGYLTFSRVAFNRDLTEAFFYTEHVCGLCGEGKYVFMCKVSGRWVVEATAPTWVS